MANVFSGDASALKELIASLETVPTKLMPAITAEAKQTVGDQYRSEFSSGRDPWGNQWASSLKGTGTTLVGETGALYAAKPTSSKGTVRMRPPKYWKFLQVGAPCRKDGTSVPRAVLPYSPSKWDGPLKAGIEKVIEAHFAKAK